VRSSKQRQLVNPIQVKAIMIKNKMQIIRNKITINQKTIKQMTIYPKKSKKISKIRRMMKTK